MRRFPALLNEPAHGQMTLADCSVTGQFQQIDWTRAVNLRRIVSTSIKAPKYLLAPEVSALLWYIEDIRQLAFYSTLWNTGARPNEALALTPSSFDLSTEQPFVTLRTLKQRQRGKGRPRKDEQIERAVPLFDGAYCRLMRQMMTTFPVARNSLLWPESPDTISRWLSRALDAARADGVHFSLASITPKTFRHSFAIHLLYNHISERELQEFMGHQCAASTQVYTRIFTLDVATQKNISFSFDGAGAAEALRLMSR